MIDAKLVSVVLLAGLMTTGCSIYRSSDREQFDGNAKAGAPNGGNGVTPTACGDLISFTDASKAFSSTELVFEPVSLQGERSCRISFVKTPSTASLSATGASSATCSLLHDPAPLLAEGLDLITRAEGWRASAPNDAGGVEFAWAKRETSGSTSICRFYFASRSQLDQQVELVRARAESLVLSILSTSRKD